MNKSFDASLARTKNNGQHKDRMTLTLIHVESK